MLSVKNHKADVVELLLQHGADPMLLDDQGNTVHELAKEETDSNELKLIRLLLNGALGH